MLTTQLVSVLLKTTVTGLVLLGSQAYAASRPQLAQIGRDRPAADISSRFGDRLKQFKTNTDSYFTPPTDSSPRSGSRTTTGTRNGSCLSETETAFTILGPEDTESVAGQTISAHPEFVWYLPESDLPFPVIFRLLAPDESGVPVPVHVAELSYAPGFVKYALPTDLPALTPGKEYRWQVIVECNPNYPSRALVQELSFEVVSAPPDLTQALATATTAAERALAYGSAGLWYDAIAQVAEPETAEALQIRSGLLNDLAALVATSNQTLSQDIAQIAQTTANP